MNIRMIQNLRAAFEEGTLKTDEGTLKLDQRQPFPLWSEEDNCYFGCVAVFAVFMDKGSLKKMKAKHGSFLREATSLLGLSPREARRLFMSDLSCFEDGSPVGKVTPKQVVAVLDNLLTTGEVSWGTMIDAALDEAELKEARDA